MILSRFNIEEKCFIVVGVNRLFLDSGLSTTNFCFSIRGFQNSKSPFFIEQKILVHSILKTKKIFKL